MKRALIALLCLFLLIAPAAAAGGDGTAANPYRIETATELQSIQNDLSAHYLLVSDIDLTGVTWTPIGSTSAGFFGTLDGDGHTISNLSLSATTSNTGLFSSLTSGAAIKDLTLDNCHVVSTSQHCANVAGSIIMSESTAETVTIQNIKLSNCSSSSSDSNIANLVGRITSYSDVDILDCTISKCSALTEATNAYSLANVVARISSSSHVNINSLVIEYSSAISATSGVGNVIGFCTDGSSLIVDESMVNTCIAESTESSTVSCIAGECGTSSSISVVNTVVTNNIVQSATNYAGGIFGGSIGQGSSISASDCTVQYCTISASASYAGGIAGRVAFGRTGVFSNCTVTNSSILATSYAAGICPAYS